MSNPHGEILTARRSPSKVLKTFVLVGLPYGVVQSRGSSDWPLVNTYNGLSGQNRSIKSFSSTSDAPNNMIHSTLVNEIAHHFTKVVGYRRQLVVANHGLLQ